MTRQEYILICVTGLTPQVVTETLYALATAPDDTGEDTLPAAIHVLSTRRGKDIIESSLLGEAGQFAKLCGDYGWNPAAIAFDVDHVHVIRDANGRELDDIRDARDNAVAADFITQFIRRATSGSARLHVSLAGGRKTMGYFVGYALSLYGRPDDRLSHVLVNAPFESQREFFYPPPEPIELSRNDGSHVSTADARVSLAHIPFVRLREGLDTGLLEGELSFSEAVAQAQQLLDPAQLRIDLMHRAVFLQGHPVRLSDTNFLWLSWFADRAGRGLPPLVFDDDAAQDLLRVATWLEGTGASALRTSIEEAQAELARGEKHYFERNRTRLNKALREHSDLCDSAAARYAIQSFGRRPHTCYGLDLPTHAIVVEGEP
jgi:CRISPR-associated protein (TIGR02584 family)